VQEQIGECDARLWDLAQALEVRVREEALPNAPVARGPGRPRKNGQVIRRPQKSGKSRNALSQGEDRVPRFHALFGVDLTAVPGVSILLVLSLLVEIGTDWSAFPSAGHFAAWLGLCPHNDRSGKKVLRRRTAPGQTRLKAILRMGAQSLWQSRSPLGEQYRRLKARLGPAAANTAMAHKLARILWHLVHHQVAYDESIFSHLDQHRTERQTRRLRKQAQALGFELTPLPKAA